MSQKTIWATIVALAIPAGISAQSVHSFYKEDDVVFKPELLGRWELDSMVVVEFKDIGDKTYGIILHLDQQSGIYARGRLFCIGRRCFLDAQVAGVKLPKDPTRAAGSNEAEKAMRPNEEFQPDRGDILLNRLHGLLLVSFSDDGKDVSMSKWQDDWLPKMAETDKLTIAHTRDEVGHVVLTAERDEMRAWVEELPNEAFENPQRLTRAADTQDDSAEGDKGAANAGRERQSVSCPT